MDFSVLDTLVYKDRRFAPGNLSVADGRFSAFLPAAEHVFYFPNCIVFPGFIDAHVHLREPGFSYKETIFSGTRAAAAGGYTHICAMPNLNPVPDCMEHLQPQLDAIAKAACVEVRPYGAITREEKGERLSDMQALSPRVAAFSDDGRGVQSESTMRSAMQEARRLGKIIAAHCEVNNLLHGGYIHDGSYCRAHGHKGISSESEWRMIERDLRLAKETGCAYHVCHISCKESVALIRSAKKEGVDATCETAPHYLTLTENDLQEDGRFKMNPPLRGEEDRTALIEGLLDGTIDMLATDHAPHSPTEKSQGLAGSLMGITGLETAFPVVYTKLVKPGILPLEKLTALLFDNASKRFAIGGDIRNDNPADFTVFDCETPFTIDSARLQSKGKATPFDGWRVYGRCVLTVHNGNIIWEAERE